MTRALAVALGLMVSIAASSARADVKIMGAGGQSCGTWTADRTGDPRVHGVDALGDTSWVVGYLSGAAVFGSNLNPLNGVDAQAVWAWLDNYCRAQPLVRIIDAAKAFVHEHPGGP